MTLGQLLENMDRLEVLDKELTRIKRSEPNRDETEKWNNWYSQKTKVESEIRQLKDTPLHEPRSVY